MINKEKKEKEKKWKYNTKNKRRGEKGEGEKERGAHTKKKFISRASWAPGNVKMIFSITIEVIILSR